MFEGGTSLQSIISSSATNSCLNGDASAFNVAAAYNAALNYNHNQLQSQGSDQPLNLSNHNSNNNNNVKFPIENTGTIDLKTGTLHLMDCDEENARNKRESLFEKNNNKLNNNNNSGNSDSGNGSDSTSPSWSPSPTSIGGLAFDSQGSLIGHATYVPASRPSRHRTIKKPVPDEAKDAKYFERRKRNNAAAKKSRDLRKQREDEIAIRASFLEKENAILRAQVTTLREESNSLRQLLIQRGLNTTGSSMVR